MLRESKSFLSKKMKYNKISLILGIVILVISIPISLIFYAHFSKKAEKVYVEEKAAYLERNQSKDEIFLLRERIANMENAFIDAIQLTMLILAAFIGTVMAVCGINFILLWQQGRQYIQFIEKNKKEENRAT